MLKIRIIFKKNPKFAGKNNSTFVRIKMRNFQSIIFEQIQTHREFFKSALAYLTLSSVNLSLDLDDDSILYHFMTIQYQVLYLYIQPRYVLNLRDQYWRCTYFSAKLAFIAKIFLILFFVHNRIKSTWKQSIPFRASQLF